MQELNDIEFINKYKNNELNSDEIELFRNRLKSDEQFRLLFEERNFEYETQEDSHADNFLKYAAVGCVAFLVAFGTYLTTTTERVKDEVIKVDSIQPSLKEAMVNHRSYATPEISLGKELPDNLPKVNPIMKSIQDGIPQNSLLSIVVDKPKQEEIIEQKVHVEPALAIENHTLPTNCDAIFSEVMVLEPSCEHEHNGSIQVSKVSGGVEPYVILLSNGHFFINVANFSGLHHGDYEIKITDSKNCQKVISNVHIPLKLCPHHVEKSHLVAHDHVVSLANAKWHISHCPENAYFEIKNKDGIHVFGSEMKKGTSDTWHLQDLTGQFVGVGVYHYTLKNTDTHEIQTGTLTVVE
jgi:hypothetical protein